MADRADESNSTPHATYDVYTSVEAVEHYTEHAVDPELFPAEKKLVERYFEPNARVLDLGCGVGRTTRRLDEFGFDVIGIDISEEMVREARSRFPELDVRVGDAANLDFPDGSFDHVLFSYSGLDLVHPEEKRFAVLREILRVLEPGGIFAFSAQNSLYLFPAFLIDWTYLWNFYVSSGNLSRWFERYRVDDVEYGVKTYFINPLSQRRQLQRVGFEFVACVGKRDNPIRFFEFQPYYVARKPEPALNSGEFRRA